MHLQMSVFYIFRMVGATAGYVIVGVFPSPRILVDGSSRSLSYSVSQISVHNINRDVFVSIDLYTAVSP